MTLTPCPAMVLIFCAVGCTHTGRSLCGCALDLSDLIGLFERTPENSFRREQLDPTNWALKWSVRLSREVLNSTRELRSPQLGRISILI